MKTKILKRILAAIIAFSAVIGTSGLSSAVKRRPPKNKQSQSSIESDDYDGTSSDEDEEGYSVCESFSDDEEMDYEEKHDEPSPYFENNLKEEKQAETVLPKTQISELEALLKKPIKSDADKKNFANMVMYMSKVKSFRDSIKSNLYEVISRLVQCSDYDKARANVAGALRDFAEKGLFNEFKEEKVNELIDILERCAQTQNARANVARAFMKISQRNLFKELTKQQIVVLIEILEKCSQTAQARANVADFLMNFAQKGLFNKFEAGQVNALMDILKKCAQSDKARANVADFLMNFVGSSLLNKFNEEQIDTLIAIFNQCAQTDKYCAKVACDIGEFIRNDFLRKCTPQQVSAISAALIECLKDKNAKTNVSYSLRLLADRLVKYSSDENARPKIKEAALDLIGRLMKHANDDALKWKISYIISTFSSNGLINGLSEDKILEIVNFLASCAGDRDAKEFVASSIASLALNHCLDFFKGQPEKLLTLVETLDECFKLGDSDIKNKDFALFIKRKVANAVQDFLVGKLETSDSVKLKDAISAFYNNPESENSQKFLDQLIQNSLLKDLTEEGKEKFKKLLGDCLFYCF